MSNTKRGRVVALSWRKVCAALPAVTLIGAGIAFSAQAAPPIEFRGVAASIRSSAIVVPDSALTMPAVRTQGRPDRYSDVAEALGLVLPVDSPPGGSAPALVLPAGTLPGSSAPVALDSSGIPVRALNAYRSAASLVGTADPACNIDWALVAAIGRVESNHARFGGNQLDSVGVAQPGIIGIPLDGTNGTARITDTDGGRLDRDKVYDRAVGPMQFIPSTWRVAGADGNRDGVKNPQNMADAATATAIYLCSGPGDLHLPGDLHGAIMRYNPSDSYVRTVTAIATAYRHGVRALPASDLPAANPAPSTSSATKASPTTVAPGAPLPVAPVKAAPLPAAPLPAAPVPAAPVPGPVPAPSTPVPATPAPVPTTPVPTTPVPTAPVPTTPVPTTPVPTTPVPCVPIPTPPTPTPTDPTLPTPTPTDPTLPNPAPPIPCQTPPAGTTASTPLTQGICTVSPAGVQTCTPAAPTASPLTSRPPTP